MKNSKTDILAFSYLWETGKFVILEEPSDIVSIVEKLTGSVVLIEDEEVFQGIVQQMRGSGAEIVTEIPLCARNYQQRILDLIDSGVSAAEINKMIEELGCDQSG